MGGQNGRFGLGRWFFRLLAVVGVSCLCSQFQVYHIAVVNNLYTPATEWLNETYGQQYVERYIEPVLWPTFVGMFPGGKMFGTAISALLVDMYGRQRMGVVMAVMLAFSGLMLTIAAYARWFVIMCASRLVCGIAVGVFLCATSLLAIECSPCAWRGWFTSLVVVFYGAGDFLGVTISLPWLLGNSAGWTWAMVLGMLVPAAIALPILCVAPESPRWLFLQDDGEQFNRATASIGFYQGSEHLEETLEDLYAERSATKRQQNSECSGLMPHSVFYIYRGLWSRASLRRPVLTTTLLNIGCQLTGIAIVITYSTLVMQHYGLSHESASTITLIMAAVKVFTSFLPPLLIERIGRCGCCILGFGGCALSHAGVLVCLVFDLPTRAHASFMIGGCWCIHMVMYNLLIAGNAALSGELLPQDARAVGLLISQCASWGAATVVTLVFPALLLGGHFTGTLLTMTVLCSLLAVFCGTAVKETAGRMLHDIQKDFEIEITNNMFPEHSDDETTVMDLNSPPL